MSLSAVIGDATATPARCRLAKGREKRITSWAPQRAVKKIEDQESFPIEAIGLRENASCAFSSLHCVVGRVTCRDVYSSTKENNEINKTELRKNRIKILKIVPGRK